MKGGIVMGWFYHRVMPNNASVAQKMADPTNENGRKSITSSSLVGAHNNNASLPHAVSRGYCQLGTASVIDNAPDPRVWSASSQYRPLSLHFVFSPPRPTLPF